jgi:phospholipase D1/2
MSQYIIKATKKQSIYAQFYVFCIQGQTMQMMYNVVANALKSMQLSDVHPQDYLNFYCLGNREHFNEESSGSNGAPVIFSK